MYSILVLKLYTRKYFTLYLFHDTNIMMLEFLSFVNFDQPQFQFSRVFLFRNNERVCDIILTEMSHENLILV